MSLLPVVFSYFANIQSFYKVSQNPNTIFKQPGMLTGNT
jgi:hypothetical protein